MGGHDAITGASLDQRVVLLALAQAADGDQTPANPADLRTICNERLARGDTPILGGLSEADVSRALYGLEDAGLVENEGPAKTSPTGKGRPLYVPGVDAETIRETLADDEDVASILEAL